MLLRWTNCLPHQKTGAPRPRHGATDSTLIDLVLGGSLRPPASGTWFGPTSDSNLPRSGKAGCARAAVATSARPRRACRELPGRDKGCRPYLFNAAKNSELVFVSFILSSRNSIAASSSIECSSLRRIHILARRRSASGAATRVHATAEGSQH
jgi:hypothetical protein